MAFKLFLLVAVLTVAATQAANPRFRAVSQAKGGVKVAWQAGGKKVETVDSFLPTWQKFPVGTSNDGVTLTGKLDQIVDLLKKHEMPTSCSPGFTQFSITVNGITPSFAEAFLSNVPNLGPGGGTIAAVTAWAVQTFAEEYIGSKITKDVVVKITDAKPPAGGHAFGPKSVYLPCGISLKWVARVLANMKQA